MRQFRAAARFSDPPYPRRNQVRAHVSVALLHGTLDVALGVALGHIVALVVQLLTFAQSKLKLDSAVFEIQ